MSLFKTLFHSKVNLVLKLAKNGNQILNYNYISRSFVTGAARTGNSTLKLSLVGAGVGALVGTGYSIHKLNKTSTHIINEENVIPMIKDPPNVQHSRRIIIPNDTTGLKITLYQYQTCPFCCKVRAFLDYYGISYDVVEVDPVLRQSIQWSQYKKVPIILAEVNDGYQQLNDSTMIISALSSFLSDNRKELHNIVKSYPIMNYKEDDGTIKSEIMNRYFLMLDGSTDNLKNTDKMMEERKWRQWVDSVLVHTLSPNVYRSREEALQAFNWFSEVGEWEKHFPAWERLLIVYVGAFAMWLVGKKLKTRHNLKDDVRQSLYDECNFWVKEIKKKGTQFMGGSKPDLSDLAVYGILNSIEGCSAFEDLLQHSSIATWYKSMKESVINHEGMRHI